MKPRDRLVLCVLVAAAGLAVIWLGVVSPKRQHATQLGTQLSAAQARLSAAQSQLAGAIAAEAGYTANRRVVKALYKAVPAGDGVPRLLVSLDRTSNYKRVDFKVITVAAAGTAAGPGATAGPVAGAPAVGGLSPISFTFTFNGGYIALQHFLRSVASYTLLKHHHVVAHDRLLTIQSVGLTPAPAATGAAPGKATGGTQAAVTAVAYSQPPASSLVTPAATAATVSATTPAATVATSTNTTR